MTTQRFCHTQLSQLFEANLLQCTIPHQLSRQCTKDTMRKKQEAIAANKHRSHLRNIRNCLAPANWILSPPTKAILAV
jgi:hypothetical protein